METNTKEMMNKAIEVLTRYEATKTGYSRTNFVDEGDLRIDEVEMLEFLFTNCPETINTLKQVCEHYRVEFNKPSSVSWLLIQTTFALDKTYKFGWLNNQKVKTLDTISDISQIPMKERYVTYLNKLREVKPDIDALFIEAYNKCQPNLNFLRIEQVFSYLYDEFKYEGIKTSYSDYLIACPHGVGNPYFSRDNYGYYIVDNHGHFSPKIFMTYKDLNKTKGLEWTYMRSQSPDSCHGNKALAEITVKQLRQLRDLAGFPKELDWEVIYANRYDMRQKDSFKEKEMDSIKAHLVGKTVFTHIDVPKGCMGKHRQAVKDIVKSFKPIFEEISKAWKMRQIGTTV